MSDQGETIFLKIYIAGMTPTAIKAKENLEKICSDHLADGQCWQIDVIDITENPQLAEQEKIMATPTVARQLPLPVRRILGDLSDTEQALVGLDLIRRSTMGSVES